MCNWSLKEGRGRQEIEAIFTILNTYIRKAFKKRF
jgi:hypothetical protein